MTENLIIISAQPAEQMFKWQLEVQCTNLREVAANVEHHVLLWYKRPSIDLLQWKDLEKKYPEVNFFYYQDENVDINTYPPLIRPFILKKHFEKYKEEFKNKIFFYIDSDVIFREFPNFEELLSENICWQSNTSSYLDYNYLLNKEIQGNIPNNEAIELMCSIGGISKEILQSYTGKTGGAQYILRGIDHTFWGDVYSISLEIRKKFTHTTVLPNNIDSVNTKYFKDENSGFQSWCADMWAVNFALWKRGIKTDVHKELDFTWAVDKAEKWFENKIYHDAGATQKGIFNKGAWKNDSPIGKNVGTLQSFASKYYVEAINKVKN
jgi:hypothetical protein